MSSQLQVSGEAKIRDIQGPVVANSGVITALDGAASQYVRGDGTLADFPTSTGGGSSVSYYLNSSVSQGTIGGVAYRQLSKTPISGAGTDITISANGYVANYITDANDPSLLEVPAGNFNCEFYFSVNSNNHNPYVYAELYKYDGTTFTLLGSNQAIPEYLTNGTTLSAYYFAIPVAVAALNITDRLAIRIYVNVDTRTVTLHTENNHLCQVVTTFSKGLTSLNNLTRQVQFLATGTSGTDFNISSSTATHTFNIPVASATNTGKLSSTDWSTFNGKVPYTGANADVDLGSNNFTAFGGTFNSILTINATGNQARALYMVTGTAGSQYGSGTGVNLFSEATDNLSILFTTASTTRKAILNGANLTTAKTFTLPDASGTIALTSNINYPVTSVFGRTGAVVAASGDYTTTQVTEGTNLYFTDARARAALSFTAGSGAYNSTTGVITIPTDNNQIANGAGYITSSALSGYLPLSGGTLTGGLNGTTATFSGLGTFYQLTMTGATAGRLFYAQTGGVFSQSGNLVWNNSTEQLGVGTPNPSAVVTAFSTNAATQLKAAGTAPAITFSNTLTSASLACVFGLATANNHFITGTAAGDMAIANQSTSPGAIVFGTGTFEKMRMTSAGDLAVGDSSASANLWVKNSGAGNTFGARNTNGSFGATIGFFGADRNTTNNSFYYIDCYNYGSGTYRFRVADSGAVTSASSVTAKSSITVSNNGGEAAILSAVSSFADGYRATLRLWNQHTGGKAWELYSTNVADGAYGAGKLAFVNSTDSVTAMVITSGGNVGIGTSSPSGAAGLALVLNSGANQGRICIKTSATGDASGAGLQIVMAGLDAGIEQRENASLTFATNATERMRITSGGFLKQKANGGSYFNGSYNEISNLAGGGSDINLVLGLGGNSNNTSSYFLICAPNNAADRLYILGNGNVLNTNGSYGTISSDRRLKENIVTATPKLDDILKLNVVNFNLIGNEEKHIGFIAQEMQEVFPSFVYQNDTRKYDEDGNIISGLEDALGVKVGMEFAILVKAIQELTQKVNELESKNK